MIRMHHIQRMVFIAFIVAYAFLALDVMTVYTGVPHDPKAPRKHEYVNNPPFTYRLLIPSVVGGVKLLFSESGKQAATLQLAAFRDSDFGKQWFEYNIGPVVLDTELSDAMIFDTSCEVLVVSITLVAFIWMLYVLGAEMFPESTAYRLLSPVVALLLIIPFVDVIAYSYDFAELFFSCACLYLLYKRRWWQYLLCLGLATLNKETTLFMVMFYFIWADKKIPVRQYITLGVIQSAIYLVIESTILYVYGPASDSGQTKAGAIAAGWFGIGVGFLTDGFINSNGVHVVTPRIRFLVSHSNGTFIRIMMDAVLVGYRWMEKPEFLRMGSWLVLINAVVFVLCCDSGEYRDLYFCTPILVLLGTHTLVSMAGVASLPVFQPAKAIHK